MAGLSWSGPALAPSIALQMPLVGVQLLTAAAREPLTASWSQHLEGFSLESWELVPRGVFGLVRDGFGGRAGTNSQRGGSRCPYRFRNCFGGRALYSCFKKSGQCGFFTNTSGTGLTANPARSYLPNSRIRLFFPQPLKLGLIRKKGKGLALDLIFG